MRIRTVSYVAIAVAGGLGFAAGPAFAQPTPPPVINAPTLLPGTPPPAAEPAPPPAGEPAAPPAAEPATPPMAEPAAPPALLGPIDGGPVAAGRMMMPAAGGTGVRAEIMAILMAQFHTMDANGDGRVTPEEFATGWESVFLLLDQNADGVLDGADGEIALRNLAEAAEETRADRAAAAGDEQRRGGGGDREGYFEYRRGDGPAWGGHFERHDNGGMFFFRFPGGMMHFFMMPYGEGGGGDDGRGHGMPGGGMGGMPFFFGMPGMPGFPGMQGFPGMPGFPGERGNGPGIQIQPAPGAGDRDGGGAGGWVNPGDDRGGGGVGGWVMPGQNDAPAPAAPAPEAPREAPPKP